MVACCGFKDILKAPVAACFLFVLFLAFSFCISVYRTRITTLHAKKKKHKRHDIVIRSLAYLRNGQRRGRVNNIIRIHDLIWRWQAGRHSEAIYHTALHTLHTGETHDWQTRRAHNIIPPCFPLEIRVSTLAQKEIITPTELESRSGFPSWDVL